VLDLNLQIKIFLTRPHLRGNPRTTTERGLTSPASLQDGGFWQEKTNLKRI